MHSGTKYLSGHADLTCGVVCGRQELMDQIWETRTTLGNCMDPHAAWMLIRGLKTLAVRVARQNENALRVAEFLEQHAKVRRVHYPFLKSHPQYAIAREQMSGGGGMVTFEVEGTGEDARRVSEAMRLFTLATSLGGVESLVSIPVLTSHAMISAEQRAEMGVTEQMVRLSVGIESVEDLIAGPGARAGSGWARGRRWVAASSVLLSLSLALPPCSVLAARPRACALSEVERRDISQKSIAKKNPASCEAGFAISIPSG